MSYLSARWHSDNPLVAFAAYSVLTQLWRQCRIEHLYSLDAPYALIVAILLHACPAITTNRCYCPPGYDKWDGAQARWTANNLTTFAGFNNPDMTVQVSHPLLDGTCLYAVRCNCSRGMLCHVFRQGLLHFWLDGRPEP